MTVMLLLFGVIFVYLIFIKFTYQSFLFMWLFDTSDLVSFFFQHLNIYEETILTTTLTLLKYLSCLNQKAATAVKTNL